jgi:hypothetical protein
VNQKPSTWIILFVLLFSALFVATACNKSKQQQRLAWNLKTLVGPYKKAGHTNSKWDAFAISALTEFAGARAKTFATNEPAGMIIATNAAAAVAAGCDDPLVNYLFIKFAMGQTNSPKAFSDAFCQTALDMEKSSYPSVRKFYAAAAAVEQLGFTYGTSLPPQPLADQVMALIGPNLMPILEDKTTPVVEAYEAGKRALDLELGDKNNYAQAYRCVEPPMFKNWPNDSLSWLLKGEGYVRMAWLSRGSGYANAVKDHDWKIFFDDLAIADEALTNAWKLDSHDERIPILMIQVAEAREKKRDAMELWFNRAMAINPDCSEACEKKLHYLYPQWYGSREDMVAFGRECVASTNWGGNVPLILSDAHREYWLYLQDPEAKTNYWKIPDVWPDIQASFDRFFQLNPEATGYYHNYAWYAYQCEQWDKFLGLIPQLGPVNYSYFGGKDEFDKMITHARKESGKSNP